MKKFILSDVCPHEVSLVSEGAIQKKFIIYKNKNEKFKFEKGEFPMKIEELIELGLCDASEVERIGKKIEKEDKSGTIEKLLESIAKILGKKVEKSENVDKMTDEEKKKEEEKKKAEEMKKTKEQEDLVKKLDELTKKVEGSVKAQELLTKLSTCQDPKEFLKVLAEAKEITKTEPEKEDVNVKVVKALDTITKRLETIELASKGLKGQDSVNKKPSNWGGAFK
jgi:hypothetical protein